MSVRSTLAFIILVHLKLYYTIITTKLNAAYRITLLPKEGYRHNLGASTPEVSRARSGKFRSLMVNFRENQDISREKGQFYRVFAHN